MSGQQAQRAYDPLTDEVSGSSLRSATPAQAAGRLLSGFSFEVTGADRAVAEACDSDLPAGVEVFVAFVPSETPVRVVRAARRLRDRGLIPVPHILARAMKDQAALDSFLGRLAQEAGVTSALVIAGDRPKADGPFESSLQLLHTGLFERHGFRRLSFALHPEGHPKVDAAVMREACAAKLAHARARGLEARLVSQFSLEAAPILPALTSLEGRALGAKVRIGLAGPTDPKTLWKYALYCGVGNSLKALHSHGETFGHLIRHEHPEALLGEVAGALERHPAAAAQVEGVHIFTFGGVAKSIAWAGQLIRQAASA